MELLELLMPMEMEKEAKKFVKAQLRELQSSENKSKPDPEHSEKPSFTPRTVEAQSRPLTMSGEAEKAINIEIFCLNLLFLS